MPASLRPFTTTSLGHFRAAGTAGVRAQRLAQGHAGKDGQPGVARGGQSWGRQRPARARSGRAPGPPAAAGRSKSWQHRPEPPRPCPGGPCRLPGRWPSKHSDRARSGPAPRRCAARSVLVEPVESTISTRPKDPRGCIRAALSAGWSSARGAPVMPTILSGAPDILRRAVTAASTAAATGTAATSRGVGPQFKRRQRDRRTRRWRNLPLFPADFVGFLHTQRPEYVIRMNLEFALLCGSYCKGCQLPPTEPEYQ